MTRRDCQMFCRSLSRHPGLGWATFFTAVGFLVGLHNRSLPMALTGAAVMSIFWLPVLWTAWRYRGNQ